MENVTTTNTLKASLIEATCAALLILYKSVKERKVREILTQMKDGRKNGQNN